MAGRRRDPANGKAVARREPERLAWERQKGEPGRAFSYFALYRDLGPHRSLPKVALDARVSVDRLKELSAKHGWVARADAYDDYLDARLREERETERIRLERTHMGLGAAMMGVVLRRMNGSPPAVGPGGETIEEVKRLDPNTLDAGDVARVAEAAVRIQRVSAGLPTDLIRGVTVPSATEVVRMFSDLVEISAKFIEDERQARWYSELQAYIEAGRRL